MLSDEEKQSIESLKNIAIYIGDNYTFSQQGIRNLRENLRIVLPAIEKKSKEIEELKEENENLLDALNNSIDIKKYWVNKDKIKEILGIEEETDSEKILSLLQTIVDENARLEDIEDKKVQIEYNNVFNKGVKSVEDKIKAKIEEQDETKQYWTDEVKDILKSLLRKE